MWDILNLIPYKGGDAPDYTFTYTSNTPYEIMTDLFTYTPFTLDALGAIDDGIITTLRPEFTVNSQPSGLGYWETIGQALYRLLSITKLYLRPKAGLAFELIYPQTSDSVNETFTAPLTPVSDSHAFFSYTERHNLVIPNKFTVFGGQSEDGTWDDYTAGVANDTTEQGIFMTIEGFEVYADFSSLEILNGQAAAYLARERAERMSGVGVIPMSCRTELYDKVGIVSTRGT